MRHHRTPIWAVKYAQSSMHILSILHVAIPTQALCIRFQETSPSALLYGHRYMQNLFCPASPCIEYTTEGSTSGYNYSYTALRMKLVTIAATTQSVLAQISTRMMCREHTQKADAKDSLFDGQLSARCMVTPGRVLLKMQCGGEVCSFKLRAEDLQGRVDRHKEHRFSVL